MGQMYRLPNGQYTKNQTEYVEQWAALNAAIERVLDAKVYAFDPGVAVCRDDNTGACPLPMWIARKIAGMDGLE